MLRLLFVFFCFLPLLVSAQSDRSLSPYFVVNVDSGESVPDFPLRSTSADVNIAGVIADVTITQVYINHSARPLEAVYTFPASTNAAVYAMEMQVGRRTITAEIQEKNKARQEYAEAQQAGKTASLLEQQRPNVFTMYVANVMPGDSIIVRMSYTEKLVPTNGVYEFVYPTVVAPRYTGAGVQDIASLSNSNTPANGIPYTKKGIPPAYDFGMTVNIASAIPFEFIRSTTHKTLLSFNEKNTARILLDPSEIKAGDRDFILQYRYAGGTIQTGLMLYEGKDENFFMLMMQPPKRVPLDSIPPREYIFVMDVSGSMSGYPIETSKKLLSNLVLGLRPTDKFNVVQFAGGAALFSAQSVEATSANVDSAVAFISRPQGSGGTELNRAMKVAMAVPAQEGFSRSIVIVTDGLISAEAAVLQSMRENLDSANVFAFGIGSSSNRYLIEAMAFAGNGEPFVVAKAEEADSAAERFRRYISSPVLTNISIRYEGFDVYETDPVAVPDLFADRPLIITGKYRGKAEGKIVVSGLTGTQNYTREIGVDSVKPRKQNKAIRLLWARERVKYLTYLDGSGQMNYYGYMPADTSVATEITSIGLKYGILTNYTSFIAVDRRVRNKTGEADSTVTQPTPLPYGMDNSAISMSGSMKEVAIVSALGFVGCSGGHYSVDIIRAVPATVGLPVTANAMQDPQSLQDVNGFYHGRLVHSNAVGYDRPFFTPGASGRIFSTVTTDMLGSYSPTAGQNSAAAVGYSPMRSYTLGFRTWEENRSRLTLSGTHLGAQNLYFNHYTPVGNKIYSLTQISQQWKGTSTDHNDDGFEDVPRVLALTATHRLSYSSQSTKAVHLSYFSNELMVHHSNMEGGQISTDAAGAYTTSDKAMGIYLQPRFGFKLGEKNWLYINSSLAAASLDAAFGIDRYHSRSLLAFAQLNNEYYATRGYTISYGAGFQYSDGEESWNNLRFDLSKQLVTAHGNFQWRNSFWTFAGGVRFEYDSKFQEIILPNASVNYTREKFSARLGGKRYRNPQLAIGQLLPLMYSSRGLSVSPELHADEGWHVNAQLSYRNYDKKVGWSASLDYGVMFQSNTTVIDLYSDKQMISVYSIKGNKPLHRVTARSEIRFTEKWMVQIEYMSMISVLKYGSVDLQQPLTPEHQGYVALNYGKYDSRLNGRFAVQYTGSQRLPQHGKSPGFVTVNLGARYKLGLARRFEVFANAFNLLDYRQKNVLFGAQPTDQSFDGWMNWGPVAGRSVQLGVTMKL